MLSDVVKQARRQLQSKVSNAFAYLQALLDRSIDYSVLAARMKADAEADAQKRDELAKEKIKPNGSEPWQGSPSLELTATPGLSRSMAC